MWHAYFCDALGQRHFILTGNANDIDTNAQRFLNVHLCDNDVHLLYNVSPIRNFPNPSNANTSNCE